VKKQQELAFRGVDRIGRVFVTESFTWAIQNSVGDPMPLNRRSRRAMKKLIRALGK